jgi:hypothetical protein
MSHRVMLLVAIACGCSFETVGGGASVGLGDDAATSGSSSATQGTGSSEPSRGTASGDRGSSADDVDATADAPTSSTVGVPDSTDVTTVSADGETTASGPACTSALLVTGDLDTATSQDAPFYDRLIALEYTVTVVHNAASQASDADGHCLVILSAIGAASDVDDKFRNVTVPVITWEYNLYEDMGMVPLVQGNWGIDDPQDDITIVDPAHPLAAGMSGTVPIFSGGGRISWGIPGGEVEIVARLPGEPTRATLFAFEQGATMADGFIAPARRVGFPGGQTPTPGTTQSVDLFEAAVLWATQ